MSVNINLNVAGHYWVYALGSGGSTSKLIGIELNDSSIKGYYINGSQMTVTTGLVGKWTNITFVVSPTAGTEKLYVDGVLKGATSITGNLSALYDLTKTFGGYIGESYWTGDPNLNGKIDDFIIYNCALTDEQIQAIANMTTTGGVIDVNINTGIGTAPIMPKYVYVPCSDGSTQELGVTWEPIDPSKYNQAGTFEVNGTTTYGNLSAKAYVKVLPQILNVVSKTEKSITLQWDQQQDAVEYHVYRSTTLGRDYTLVYSGTDTTFTDTGLQTYTTYYYYVNYTTNEGISPDYPILAVKTKGPIVGPPAKIYQQKICSMVVILSLRGIWCNMQTVIRFIEQTVKMENKN